MLKYNTNANDGVTICRACGTAFVADSVEDLEKCPRYGCTGVLKTYRYTDGSMAIYALDHAGFEVNAYHFAAETDIFNRELRIEFAESFDFKSYIPPKGFTVPEIREKIGALTTRVIIKSYESSLPQGEFASQLAHDKSALLCWIYSLPLVKAYIAI
jgi:hypothetical protein